MLYNLSVMFLTPDAMRVLLVLCILSLAVLAAFYLCQRDLSLSEYLGWGLIVVMLPLVGPFLVIFLRPGVRAKRKI